MFHFLLDVGTNQDQNKENKRKLFMQILGFLFFASVLGLAVVSIRATLSEASERIGLALAGEYRLTRRTDAPVYVARRRAVVRHYRPTATPRRLAA
jgi:hypothetical protein